MPTRHSMTSLRGLLRRDGLTTVAAYAKQRYRPGNRNEITHRAGSGLRIRGFPRERERKGLVGVSVYKSKRKAPRSSSRTLETKSGNRAKTWHPCSAVRRAKIKLEAGLFKMLLPSLDQQSCVQPLVSAPCHSSSPPSLSPPRWPRRALPPLPPLPGLGPCSPFRPLTRRP